MMKEDADGDGDGDGDGDDDGDDDDDDDEDEDEEEDVEEEDRSQDREAHFVRACTVEMHMDIWEEPFCMEIYRKSAGRVSRARHFVRACAGETHMDISQEPFCVEIYRENAGRVVWPHFLEKNTALSCPLPKNHVPACSVTFTIFGLNISEYG